MGTTVRRTLATLLFAAWSALPVQAAEVPVSFGYKGYTGGLYAAKMRGSINPANNRFKLSLQANDAGISSLVKWSATISASGLMQSNGVGPENFALTSTRRKKTDRRVISYTPTGATVRFSNNPSIPASEFIQPAQTRGSVDPAAAFMAILNYVDLTGNCTAAFRVFDGKSLYRFDVRTLGSTNLSQRNLAFRGRALHCRINPVPLAGKATRPNSKARMAAVDMWVGKPVAGGPMLPVKMSARIQGIPITLLMTSVQ